VTALLVAATGATPVGAQARAYLFTIAPDVRPQEPRSLIHVDVGYGERLFAGLGPERLEQRVGAQLGLGGRVTLVAQAGVTPPFRSDAGHGSVEAEMLITLTPSTARGTLAIGMGGMRDYTGVGVVLGRLAAGYRGPAWDMAGNVRVERPLVGPGAQATAHRDAIDVITTAGVARRVSGTLRLGLETVAEDLEGLFEREEAEGGAKVMIGPTVAIAPRGSHWQLLAGGGRVIRVTHSATVGTGGASRDLTARSGYVVRTVIVYSW
jgi:hypothetical protein